MLQSLLQIQAFFFLEMEHTFKEKGGFLVKKKSKRMENVLTGVLVAVLLIASGFMGIENFEPVVRHLTITDRSMADEEASSERGSEKLTADGGEESLETAAV